ncbi:Hypothetical protein BN69_2782 [Methylocystis sp. SC2]|nr:Hypothetical protein BN69_2782 [Methylocystis sp. SC2]
MTQNAKHELRFFGSASPTTTAARRVVHSDDDFPRSGPQNGGRNGRGLAASRRSQMTLSAGVFCGGRARGAPRLRRARR